MFKKKKIILSFDYELFFGDKSGTVQKTLIEPTNALLDSMDKAGLKGTFFVDVMMLKYLKQEGVERTDSDYKLIVDQLHDLLKRGHRLELHLHPHWVDAKYLGQGLWDFSDFRHYMLSSFSIEEIENMFLEGYETLTKIAHQIDASYKIVAFRAGGWAIQPFDIFISSFRKCGIVVDSSTCFGMFSKRPNRGFDFRDVPAKEKYNFSNDIRVENSNGPFVEIPISTYKKSLFHKLLYPLYRFWGYFDNSTDGTHIRICESTGIVRKKIKKIDFGNIMLTLSTLPPLSVFYSVWSSHNQIVCIIDHPKDLTKATLENIMLLGKIGSPTTYIDLINEST